jgi:hypothetical protein
VQFLPEEIELMINENPEQFAPTFIAILAPFLKEIKSKNLIK